MKLKIIDKKVAETRKAFNILDFPGDFFNYIIDTEDYENKYNLLLFKQDIDTASGFIGYGNDNISIICINYKKTIGHQNFTLAHEIGHLVLHKGVSTCDTDEELNMSNESNVEKEANQFAAELLYPLKNVQEDYRCITSNFLFNDKKKLELADYLNTLCEKYCISFKFAYYRIFTIATKRSTFNIEKRFKDLYDAIGGLGKRYNLLNYSFVPGHPYYVPYVGPYNKLNEYATKLKNKELISKITNDSILGRNKRLEGLSNEIFE